MTNPEFLEKSIDENKIKESNKEKPMSKRFTFSAVALSIGLIAIGVYFATNGFSIKADTAEPPTPEEPASRVSPPTPTEPIRNELPPVPTLPNEFVFKGGWSMISGEKLYGYDLTNFRDAGLALYSFNDPSYANRDWAIVFGDSQECQEEKIGCDVITAQPPLGYYVYNPKDTEARVTLQPSATPELSNNIYGRGWHVMYWDGSAISEQDLLDRISLTYSDGKVLTAKQATTDAEHKVSLKIYGVVDENTIDIASALKELSTSSGENKITTIPQKSYFWLYLRRTTKRVTAMSINDSSTATDEKVLIDTWIEANNLTDCGDPADTMYTGGSCLFDESTGEYRDKYELIIEKFPDKPWQN